MKVHNNLIKSRDKKCCDMKYLNVAETEGTKNKIRNIYRD
jgi:hypothetical protein